MTFPSFITKIDALQFGNVLQRVAGGDGNYISLLYLFREGPNAVLTSGRA